MIPPHVREVLQLTPEQDKQIHDLQAEVRAKLEKILTPEQRERLAEMHRRGPGGPGGGPPDGPDRPGRGPGRGPRPPRGGPPGDLDDDAPGEGPRE